MGTGSCSRIGSHHRRARIANSRTDRERLAALIYRSARLEGEFNLRSGTTATEYFDKYRFESDPRLLRQVVNALHEIMPPDVDALGGLELGGIPLATMLSQVSGKPSVFVRKQAKDYGTARVAEGMDVNRQRLCLVEDVVTSGGQLLSSASMLRALGAAVPYACCVIDRQAGAGAALAAVGIELRALFTRDELRASDISMSGDSDDQAG